MSPHLTLQILPCKSYVFCILDNLTLPHLHIDSLDVEPFTAVSLRSLGVCWCLFFILKCYPYLLQLGDNSYRLSRSCQPLERTRVAVGADRGRCKQGHDGPRLSVPRTSNSQDSPQYEHHEIPWVRLLSLDGRWVIPKMFSLMCCSTTYRCCMLLRFSSGTHLQAAV